MAEIVDLLQNVAQKIRRAPQPTLVHAYREAARKFCLESHWLRRQVIVDTLADGTQDYDLTLIESVDADLEIIAVEDPIKVTIADGSEYPIRPSNQLVWVVQVAPTSPQTWAYVPESAIKVFPPPDAVYTMTLTVDVQPIVNAQSLPDDLLRKWDRALSSGALAYLYDIAGQPWTNPGLARIEAVKFQAAINNAKGDQQRGFNTGTVMARIRRLF